MSTPQDRNFGFDTGTVIITGAASGIGRETALEAKRQGLGVIAWDINAAGLEGLAGELRATGRVQLVETAVVDISDIDAVAAAMRAVTAAHKPRYLVNNAGPPSGADLPFERAIANSLVATREITRLWLDGEPSDPVAVNVASVAGNLLGLGEWYSAAKAGIVGYTRSLAVSRPGGLRVNAVAPGLIDTARLQATLETERGKDIVKRNPLGRAGRPEEVAAAIMFLLSPSASLINGTLLVCDGGSSLVL
ncbi:gluconate 5-dehydrogenase [Sphingomonas sp. DBB INV C78]|uniref:SDR family NAD(P)-dependent oxidoreductase n=1 Tax=Sphingomonas sp. DBB INV C78 TaxID=3349434 RepID=UPI0036D3B603